jgi:hypothetical protein
VAVVVPTVVHFAHKHKVIGEPVYKPAGYGTFMKSLTPSKVKIPALEDENVVPSKVPPVPPTILLTVIPLPE